MIRQLGEDKKPKNRNNRGGEMEFEARNLTPDTSADNDIDPADFLDPEEFRTRRRDYKSTRP
jgi:hypothetical protein